MSERWRERERGREREREGQGGTERDREGQRGTERDKEGQRGTERENQGLAVSPKRERERGIFWGGLEMFLILGGIRVIFAVPLIHLKSGAPPTVDPRVLNFKGSNFKTLLTIFWGRAHVFL